MIRTAPRRLIVNADDFGQSPLVNRGIVQAHRDGIVTSTSLMVRWPAAAEAQELRRTCPRLSVGLHLDFGEWFYRDGDWPARYEVVNVNDRAAVAAEVARQLAAFRQITGGNPTHLDSHQHVHLQEPARAIVAALGKTLGVNVRRCDSPIHYCGAFYGQDFDGSTLQGQLSVENLIEILAALPPGTSELCCHPAAGNDLTTMYAAERVQELAVLCDARLRATLARFQIELCAFADLRDRPGDIA